MPKTCPNDAQNMSKWCPEHVQIMPKTCPIDAHNMPKTCLKHVWDMTKTWPKHVWNIAKSSLKHGQNMPDTWPDHVWMHAWMHGSMHGCMHGCMHPCIHACIQTWFVHVSNMIWSCFRHDLDMFQTCVGNVLAHMENIFFKNKKNNFVKTRKIYQKVDNPTGPFTVARGSGLAPGSIP